MKCVETYKHRDAAREKQQLLRDRGINARVVVDPLESMAPALSDFHDVVLMVEPDDLYAAQSILRESLQRAG
jgi:hypothetical protein